VISPPTESVCAPNPKITFCICRKSKPRNIGRHVQIHSMDILPNLDGEWSSKESSQLIIRTSLHQGNLALDRGLTSRRAILLRLKYAHNCSSIHHSLHQQVLDQQLHCVSCQGFLLAKGDTPITFPCGRGLSTISQSSRLLLRLVFFSSFGVKICEHSRT
jgi:hypothetical protein